MAGLTTYIDDYLGDLKTSLWSSNTFLISEILSAYGVETETEATNIKKLYSIARYYIWKRVMVVVSQSYDFSANGGSFKTSQLYEIAKQNMMEAYAESYEYLVDSYIPVTMKSVGYEDEKSESGYQ